MTLLSALPFSVGGFGIREASSIFIFPEVNSSLIVLSSLAYSIGVSGSITLIGIIYIYLRRKFPYLK